MSRIKLVDRLENARRYAAEAGQIARQARRHAIEAHASAEVRRARARVLIEKGEAAVARSHRRRNT